MAVTAQTLRLQRQIREQVNLITDVQTRELVAAWADAWDEVAPDLLAALLEQLTAGNRVTRAQLLRSVRLRRALEAIRDHLDDLGRRTSVRIIEDLQEVIDTAGGAQASIIDTQLPPNAAQLVDLDTWSRVDERQLAAIVRRSTQRITSRSRRISPDAYQALRRELIRGVAAGTNPRQTAARIVRRAEQGFNGGLTRALTIARTETLDAHRAAAQLGQAQHADVLKGWAWLASLDQRTCPSCWSQHGTVHPLDEPGPLDHQQGRCSRTPVLRSWKDLGFDLEEPPSLIPDAATEFGRLSADDQRAVLGPKRYAAWVRGEFPMDAWSVRRTTDGWRDSFGVAAAPQSGGRRSRNAA